MIQEHGRAENLRYSVPMGGNLGAATWPDEAWRGMMGARRRWGSVIAASALAIGAATAATGAGAGEQPMLPFEVYSEIAVDASTRLRFDDFAGKIFDARIERLLRSGNILGDRVMLRNQIAVYFPDGHIVSSTAEFHTYRPLPGLQPWNVYYRDQIEINPHYGRIGELDDLVGATCAEMPYLRGRARRGGGESFARLRINRHGVISLVLDSPGRYDYLTDEPSRSFNVVSAVDVYYLGDPAIVQPLIEACRRDGVTVKTARANVR